MKPCPVGKPWAGRRPACLSKRAVQPDTRHAWTSLMGGLWALPVSEPRCLGVGWLVWQEVGGAWCECRGGRLSLPPRGSHRAWTLGSSMAPGRGSGDTQALRKAPCAPVSGRHVPGGPFSAGGRGGRGPPASPFGRWCPGRTAGREVRSGRRAGSGSGRSALPCPQAEAVLLRPARRPQQLGAHSPSVRASGLSRPRGHPRAWTVGCCAPDASADAGCGVAGPRAGGRGLTLRAVEPAMASFQHLALQTGPGCWAGGCGVWPMGRT